jgi:ubiquinone/menaquinone biosynthesis C-methylase UbiE
MANEDRAYAFRGNQTMDAAMRRREAGMEAAFLLPFLSPEMSLVDAGCGQGTITLGLARALSQGNATGFDTQEAHIAHARDLASRQGVANVTFEVGDLFDSRFANSPFDVAYANAVLSHQSDPAAGIAALSRMVKPGGLLALRDRGGQAVFRGQGHEAMRRGFEILWQMLDRITRNPYGSQVMGEAMNGMCREAGLDVLNVSASWEVHTAAELVAGAGSNRGPLAGPLRQGAIQAGMATEDELKHIQSVVEGDWMKDPDAYFAIPWFEVVSKKP